MNVNKKFDRFKQWAGEKMGGEARTNTSDDFRALEMEMNLRHEGMDRLHKSMSMYVKAVGKKSEGDDRDKMLPVGYLGATMISHGQDFSPDSEFGNCLTSFGRANEAISHRQENYIGTATAVWLESLERSLAQLKEYQAARKKLETRRIAYDASLAKMQKAKKEDFRVEEELRAQKAKYEESSEDVYRRMEDIKDAEVESVTDITKFLEEELAYHDSCREILLDLRRNWPATTPRNGDHRKAGVRGRSNTARSFQAHDKFNAVEEEPELPPRVTIPSVSRTDSMRRDAESPRISRTNSMRRDYDSPSSAFVSSYNRFGEPAGESRSRDYSPESNGSPPRDPSTSVYTRTPLRSLTRVESAPDTDGRFALVNRHNISPPSSVTSTSTNGGPVKKGPPPPPPSRAKKPAPPPPMKRAAFSASTIPQTSH